MNRTGSLLFIIAVCCTPLSPVFAEQGPGVEFTTYQYAKTYYRDGSSAGEPEYDGSPYLYVDFTYLEPVSYKGAPAEKKLRRYCRGLYFGFDSDVPEDTRIEALLSSYASAAEEDWRENGLDVLEEFPDADSAAMWEIQNSMSIEYNQAGLLSIGHHVYQYSGGTHGIHSSAYSVYDIESGKPVSLDILFTGDWYEALAYTISAAVKEEYGLDSFASLMEAGFFADDLEPTDNFYLTGDGITFYYNVYEVAPYVMGGIEVTVPYTAIGALLDTGGVIGRVRGTGVRK